MLTTVASDPPCDMALGDSCVKHGILLVERALLAYLFTFSLLS